MVGMGNANAGSETPKAMQIGVPIAAKPEPQRNDKNLKICCACPETKKMRDECIVMRGEENCL